MAFTGVAAAPLPGKSPGLGAPTLCTLLGMEGSVEEGTAKKPKAKTKAKGKTTEQASLDAKAIRLDEIRQILVRYHMERGFTDDELAQAGNRAGRRNPHGW